MGAERTAVIGVGQTKYAAARRDVSIAGLLREAAYRALEMAQRTWSDVDAVIIGKAPDFFEGVMMPEVYLAEALGAVGKPIMRVHTAGSVGGSTACVAASMVQSRVHRCVLTIGWEKQSESNAMWALSLPQPLRHIGQCRGGRLFLADHPSLHDDDRRAGADRLHGGPQGPAPCPAQPLRPSPPARPHFRAGGGLADAVGPDPLFRDVPVLGRCVRHGSRRRGLR